MLSHSALILTLSLFTIPLHAKVARYELRDMSHRNLLSVSSDGPLERAVGISSWLDGWVELDPENLAAGIKGELVTDLRAMETGVELRDLVMKDKLLQVTQYPRAVAVIKKWAKETSGKLKETPSEHPIEVEVEVKGKKVQLTAPLKLAYFPESEFTKARLPGNLLRLSAKFSVQLEQMGIQIPDLMKALIAKSVEISVDAAASDKLPNQRALLPEGPKPKERDPAAKK